MAEWSKNQSATVEALSQVLAVIDRKDIIQMLYSDSRSLQQSQRSYGPSYYTLQNMNNSMRPQNGAGTAAFQPTAMHNISQHSMQQPHPAQTPMANYLQQQQQFGNHYVQQANFSAPAAPQPCYPPHLVNTQSPKTQTTFVTSPQHYSNNGGNSDAHTDTSHHSAPGAPPSGAQHVHIVSAPCSMASGDAGVVYTSASDSQNVPQPMHNVEMI